MINNWHYAQSSQQLYLIFLHNHIYFYILCNKILCWLVLWQVKNDEMKLIYIWNIMHVYNIQWYTSHNSEQNNIKICVSLTKKGPLVPSTTLWDYNLSYFTRQIKTHSTAVWIKINPFLWESTCVIIFLVEKQLCCRIWSSLNVFTKIKFPTPSLPDINQHRLNLSQQGHMTVHCKTLSSWNKLTWGLLKSHVRNSLDI